jgi:hypothetical protein
MEGHLCHQARGKTRTTWPGEVKEICGAEQLMSIPNTCDDTNAALRMSTMSTRWMFRVGKETFYTRFAWALEFERLNRPEDKR